MRIDGATALVTGGGSGLGEATARELAQRGADIVIFDRNGEAARRVAEAIGGRAVEGDVASEADGARAIAAAGEGAPFRILVNCAGIGGAGRILPRDGVMPLTDFERTIRVNLIGTFNMLRLSAEAMAGLSPLEGGGRGIIVNTASVAATDGQIGQAAYAASKGGIVSLALPVARELARVGIRVNTIAPGLFLTPLMDELPQAAQAALAAAIPYPNRLGDPAEFAAAVCFAVENDYLNAEVIRLDGALRLAPK
ncbi:SDR family NAD(P)-dependent oxidoreductase [Rhizobium halophytocola]|uniref:NAD(P)-dependent dehydrogenase (Short-subunit alcohol dehydrogenase family) n=1 Tax=Rhizobium halophytocola TaxID=735519 RepID=A0ABS4E1G1_9HYPH|nr:SDR family NAD(P)-dependent oxidoreductase [Rhizobium halophytocola]MBP1851774.1 NAD(P)-dependent dehydrogenase (short-subunit alcohol dehydrogenase family) [Rhizobium halophytocola]